MKIWQFVPNGNGDDSKLDCVATLRLVSDAAPTALAVQEGMTGAWGIEKIAVGFADGSVTILAGDFARERPVRVRVAPAPGEMIVAKAIVFSQFCGEVLYCVSEMSVVVIVPVVFERAEGDGGGKALAFRRDVLDNRGAARRELCCVMEESAQLVVAKEEALYFFNREGRGPCLAFPTKGPRASVSNVGNYLIHSSGPGSITAYDVVNKLIAYRGKGIVSCAFQGHAPGVRIVLLVLEEGSILKLSEISLEERVNMLLNRGLYVPAVRLARVECARQGDKTKAILTQALRQYAEYLMSKDRYNDAAEQLVETIGDNVQPSWVISRLVEQSGLRSGLRLYLEALHAAGKAAFVHTKVLITCYRHDRARGTILGCEEAEKTNDEYVFNVFSDVDWSEDEVDAAIKLCRDAGLFKVAERVSRRRGRYVQLARTLVEDLHETDKALELLRALEDADALRVLQACGRQLLVKDPVNFVHYLSDAICQSTAMIAAGQSEPVLQLCSFLPIFIDMPKWRAVLLERVLGSAGGIPASETPRAWILLFESLVCVDVGESLREDRTVQHLMPHEEDVRSEQDGTSESGKQDEDKSSASESAFDGREQRETGRRALTILQSRRSVIDLRAALEIAEQYGHGPCLEYLYEHLRLYKELGICLRMRENGISLLRTCRRHGDREPRLWMECLRLYAPLASKEEYGEDEPGLDVSLEGGGNQALENFGEDSVVVGSISETGSERTCAQDIVDEAMLALERGGTLSPMEIIEIVTESAPDGRWGIVREFFERCVAGLARVADGSEHAGLLLQGEVDLLRKEAKRLGEETFVVKPRLCAGCGEGLDVPAVHFFCEHSFHAGCITGEEKECGKCVGELDGVISMRQALQDKNGRHDEFFGALRNSRDGFATVIEFLERSPFI